MSKVTRYLDCGCALLEDGSRSWCPTCAESDVTSATEKQQEQVWKDMRVVLGMAARLLTPDQCAQVTEVEEAAWDRLEYLLPAPPEEEKHG